MSDFHTKSMERLFEAVSLLSSKEECAAFFDDICTITELQDMAQRLDTAILLKNGANYQDICKEVGVSTATISRVNRCLNYGSGGYNAVIKKLEEKE